MYVGDMVQSTQTKVSYKSKKKKALPKSNWDVVPNTHEALVDRYIFESVQGNVKRTNKSNIISRDKRLFENLLYCKECGNTLTVSYRKNHNYWTINCNRYSREPRRMCEPHFSPYDKLEESLLEVIKSTCKQYVDSLNIIELSKDIANNKKNINQDKEQLNEQKRREKEYVSKLDMLYQDKFKGIISESTFTRIAKDTENSLSKIRYEIEKLQNDKKDEKVNENDLKQYEEKIRELLNIENPSRELLQAIIEKIIIDKDRNVEIIYKFKLGKSNT